MIGIALTVIVVAIMPVIANPITSSMSVMPLRACSIRGVAVGRIIGGSG